MALIALALSPSIVSAEQRWLKATSSNFEVYTTSGEKRAREAVLYFEQVRSFFQRAVHSTRSPKGRVRVVAFQSQREYKPYQMEGGRTAYAGGGPDRDEIVMQSFSVENYPIAIHEYVHILLKPFKHVPLWLNEGMAQLYQTLRPDGTKVLVGDLLPGALDLLQQNKLIDLETLCAVGYDSPYYTKDHAKVSMFYSESWALTHMLSLNNDYRPKFNDFVRLTLAGNEPAAAFQQAFGKQMWEVMVDLRRYLNARRFQGVLFDVTLTKSAENPEVRPVTSFESGLVLASILADISKMDEARQAYLQLAKENPASPEVPEALAYLAWRREQRDESRAQFARAVDLGSKNAHLYYDYCALLGQAGAALFQQVSLLRKAVELDPEYQDARYHLGFLLMAEDDYAGALAQFGHLKNVEPDQAFQFFQAVAYACHRTGDNEAARANALRASQFATDPAQKSTIEQLQAALDRHPPEQPQAEETREETEEAEESRPALADGATAGTSSGEPPRGPKALIVERRLLKTVEGTLDQIDCLGTTARIHVTADGRPVRLLIDNPRAIEVRGTGAGTFVLTCGTQKPRRPVLIKYEPAVNDKLSTAGLVRVMEMR
jgi:tetratricopeptide (TPR) repeat protein